MSSPSYSITGPSQGAVGIASASFVLTLNEAAATADVYYDITVTASDDGLILTTAPIDSVDATGHPTITKHTSDGGFEFDYVPTMLGEKTLTITNNQGWPPVVVHYQATGGDAISSPGAQRRGAAAVTDVQIDYRTADRRTVRVPSPLARVTLVRHDADELKYQLITPEGGLALVRYRGPFQVPVPSTLHLARNGRADGTVTFARVAAR